jgi:hypothetical protein
MLITRTQVIYVCALLLGSVYIVQESPKQDARTTLLLVTLSFVISLVIAKQSMFTALVIVLIGAMLSITDAIAARANVVHYSQGDTSNGLHGLPSWHPVLSAQKVLVTWFLLYFVTHTIADENDF